ncbi:MAG: hypothetical protein KBD64_04875 [Gammaproteobacteria bacterium]|nr:hypothetical protein [Gammaproteobacteria bacterium]
MGAVTNWVLGPVWQAIFLVALCYVVPYLDTPAIVLQVFITLRQGLSKGLTVSLSGILIGVVLSFFVNTLFLDLDYNVLVQSLQWTLLVTLPLLGFAALLRQSVSLSLTLQVMTFAFMILLVICCYGEFHLFPELLNNQINANVAKITETLVKSQSGDSGDIFTIAPERIEQINQFITLVFEVLTIYTMYIGLLLLARTWQSYVFMPKAFGEEFRNLRCGLWLGVIIIASWFSILLVSDSIAQSSLTGVLLLGAIWLLINGITLVHWCLETFRISKWYLLFFYLLLLIPIVSSFLVLTLVLVGLTDSFINLRSFMLRKKI